PRSAAAAASGARWAAPAFSASPASRRGLRLRDVEAVHGGGDALDEQRLDGVAGALEVRVERRALVAREGREHVVDRVLPRRRAPDPEAHAREVAAAEPLLDVGEAAVAARAAARAHA